MHIRDETQLSEDTALVLMEQWLRSELIGEHGADATVRHDVRARFLEQSAWQRMALVRRVLDGQPELDRAVQRLSVALQLRLSLDVLGGVESPEGRGDNRTPSVRCLFLSGTENRRANAVGASQLTNRCIGQSHRHARPRGRS